MSRIEEYRVTRGSRVERIGRGTLLPRLGNGLLVVCLALPAVGKVDAGAVYLSADVPWVTNTRSDLGNDDYVGDFEGIPISSI